MVVEGKVVQQAIHSKAVYDIVAIQQDCPPQLRDVIYDMVEKRIVNLEYYKFTFNLMRTTNKQSYILLLLIK